MTETNASGEQGPCISLLDIAQTALQAESVRRAAVAVVKEWQDGIITTKEGHGCGGLTIACLRDALGGYIPDDVTSDMPKQHAMRQNQRKG